jgi:DNA invertase Pin-like site-specific DNA recombinase
MKIYYYLRVSTAEQAGRGNSLDVQRERLTGYSLMQGWKDRRTDMFVDAGVSGSVPLGERPEGRRLLAAVKPGDVIAVTKLDRMFRSAKDALAVLEDLKGRRVALHMLDLGGDVLGNGIGKMVFTILAAVAENERERIAERIREAKQHLVEQGIYAGGKRPFGFDVVDGRLEPNANEQRMLARMKRMRAQGKTYRAIAAAAGFKDAKTVKRILDRCSR